MAWDEMRWKKLRRLRWQWDAIGNFQEKMRWVFLCFFSPPKSAGARQKRWVFAMRQGGRRLGEGGSSHRVSARSWGRKGGGPSIASSPCAGKSRRLAASARVAAMDASAAQRSAQAVAAVDCAQAGSVRARARARCRTRCTAWGDHRPPTSKLSGYYWYILMEYPWCISELN